MAFPPKTMQSAPAFAPPAPGGYGTPPPAPSAFGGRKPVKRHGRGRKPPAPPVAAFLQGLQGK